ncbi:MAG: leucine--tRNA ligase [Verrucomicrobia bacterium]|nr:leucine--tRNA ligase [Verrucomicrobiota bacterium]MBI3869134.1 leucine--tRNA ligase [Verrucomicrobiota bacterium]
MSQRRQYPFHLIEPKWQAHWEAQASHRAWNPGDILPPQHPFALRHQLGGQVASAANLPPKCYILDMFPYPSGAGLHVGHPEGYTATDILSRFRRAQGFNVLHPMGWDAFGLPAEQYAIKTGRHPRITTNENIATFKKQIRSLGFSYDWSREIDTTDPIYFRWTQWIFLQIYNSWFNPETRRAEPVSQLPIPADLQRGPEAERRAFVDSKRLAFVTEAPVWWCEALGTVLANEEVIDGRSEVGDHPVVRKPMRQWMLRITAYAERLLEDLNTIDWTDSLKEMQRNWIGKSEGAQVEFRVEGVAAPIVVFTTRPDTLFGATYMVLSPEHPFVSQITRPAQRDAVRNYQETVARKSDLERTELAKEKTGVFTGAFAINPVTGREIPVWIADYVLASYGTGAIMAVPAHDTRDFEFAQKFNLPIAQVIDPPGGKDWRGYTDDGVAVNSSSGELSLDGQPTAQAKQTIIAWLESRKLGRRTVNFKLRDWLFSRQRYWGEPFPIVWRKDASGALCHEALPESALPLIPPPLDDYKPTPDGQPPLARATAWVNLPDGSARETNTMPQWAGSCWYYLRYLDSRNESMFLDRGVERYWVSRDSGRASQTPGVDLYVGGTEHAVLHLLYARFWHKVLFDLGHVSTPEPFHKLVNQGLILGEDGQKMSKSRGNVVNPDDVLKVFGADAFRLYEMFMGPLEMVKPWNTQGVEGVYRFLGRVWRLFVDEKSEVEFEQSCAADASREAEFLKRVQLQAAVQAVEPTAEQLKTLHACIKKVTEDLEGMRFNTAISGMMVFVNDALAWTVKPASALADFLVLLQPFAPHIAEELWEMLSRHAPVRNRDSAVALGYQPWPAFDPARLVESAWEVPVQVNGKLRDKLVAPTGISAGDLEKAALASEKIRPFLEGKNIKKVIVVPGKLVNIVVG